MARKTMYMSGDVISAFENLAHLLKIGDARVLSMVRKRILSVNSATVKKSDTFMS